MYLTSTTNQKNLPRYFSQVFEMAATMNTGILDFVLPDGRVFRANGKNPGPVAQVDIHNPEVFARLIREGDLGFSDAYLDSWWST
ncbi:MAG: SAM-dependent methyltransferase, partial [Marinovum sp.]|nr:SAM-dependent methyltransferase [Marinovum sp.]